MQLSDKAIFICILVAATQLTRIIPVVFEDKIGRFLKNEKLRGIINDALFFLLICYCYRDLSFTPEYYLRLGVALYVFIIQFKFEKTLLSIFTGTFIYMAGRYFL
jgi:branched-subunit amino acid transport protein AzlD